MIIIKYLLFIFILQIVQINGIINTNCQLFEEIMEEKINDNRPIVIMLYFKYGSLYSRIKGDWEFIAQQNKMTHDFYQHDMQEKNCITQYFNQKMEVPFFIFIMEKKYYAQFFYDMNDVEKIIKNQQIVQYQPVPRNKIMNKILKYVMDWKNQQFLIASLVTLLILVLTYFRLQIFKDEPHHKD